MARNYNITPSNMPKRRAAKALEAEAQSEPESARTSSRPFVVLVLVLLALIGANVFAFDLVRLGPQLRPPRVQGGEIENGREGGDRVRVGLVGQEGGGGEKVSSNASPPPPSTASTTQGDAERVVEVGETTPALVDPGTLAENYSGGDVAAAAMTIVVVVRGEGDDPAASHNVNYARSMGLGVEVCKSEKAIASAASSSSPAVAVPKEADLPICALSALLHTERKDGPVLVLGAGAAVNPGRAGWEVNDVPGPGVGPDIAAAVAAEGKDAVTAVFFAEQTATMGGAHAVLFNVGAGKGDQRYQDAVALVRELANQAIRTGDFFCSQQGAAEPSKRVCEALSPEGSALVLSPSKAASALAAGSRAVQPSPYQLYRFDMRLAWPESVSSSLRSAFAVATPSLPALKGPGGKDRRPSYPMISGDGFRGLCRYRCGSAEGPGPNGGCNFEGADLPPGQCVFVDTTHLDTFRTGTEFLKQLWSRLPNIKHPFVLVTHNGDLALPDGELARKNYEERPEDWIQSHSSKLNHPMIAHWFTQNGHYRSATKPAKLTIVPIGVENRYNSNSEQFIALFGKRRAAGLASISSFSPPPKTLLVAFGADAIKPDRGPALEHFRAQAWATVGTMNRAKWETAVFEHKWTLSPHGHGLDCHRTWEVLMLGGFVVVKASTMDSLYEGLPVLVVGSWAEATKELLDAKYEEFAARDDWQMDKLLIDHWRQRIRQEQWKLGGFRGDGGKGGGQNNAAR